jgi:hypothetical protein
LHILYQERRELPQYCGIFDAEREPLGGTLGRDDGSDPFLISGCHWPPPDFARFTNSSTALRGMRRVREPSSTLGSVPSRRRRNTVGFETRNSAHVSLTVKNAE